MGGVLMEQNEAFLSLARNITFQVNHAVHGVHSGNAGRNRLPSNRLYYMGQTREGGPGGEIGWTSPNGRRASLPLKPNAVYFMPRNVDLSWAFNPGTRMAAFHFNVEVMTGHDVFEGQRACRELPTKKRVVDSVLAEMRSTPALAVSLRLSAIILESAAWFAETTMEDVRRHIQLREKYAPLLAELERRPSAQVGVEQLARRIGVSRECLSKRFVRDVGTPLKRYLTSFLVQRASELLSHTTLNVKEVAEKLEFSSEFYFSRFFSKHTGMSPSAFRETYR